MFRLLKYLNKWEWFSIFSCIFLILAMVFLELEIPEYMKSITNLLQTGGEVNEILIEGSFMLLCALGAGLLAVVVRFFSARLSSNLGFRLRKNIYSIVQDMSAKEMNKFSVPSLITRTTNDVNQVQMFLSMGLQPIFRAPIMAVWAISIILGKSWEWSAVTGVAVAILVIMLSVIFVSVLPKMKNYQTQIDHVNQTARDTLIGTRVVRAYNAEKYEEKKFEKKNQKLTNTDYFITKMMSFLSPGMTFIMSGLTLGIYWVGAIIINNSPLQEKMFLFSDMIVFSSYAMQIVMAFIVFAMIFIMFPRAHIAGKRIYSLLNCQPSIKSGSQPFEEEFSKIEFRNVSFQYQEGEEKCLENLSFEAKRGETVAIIGATGSGKTTLINLICRLYDVSDGEILINDRNIKEYDLQHLHNLIGYASQKAYLFSGTIQSNINFGGEKKDSVAIKKSLKNAQAEDFVNKKENKEESEVLQDGSNFSGGQKQRLSIARAIAKSPQILILDDSFSALDYNTDKKMRQTLKEEYSSTTKFIVAQRIGTIKDADQIIVLEDGKIVGKGNHDELMKNCDIYNEIALSQFSKEEL